MDQNRKLNVLIVDDIVVNRMLLGQYMIKFGYNYFQARNGKDAIDILREENIDIVLMDIEMPVMNGIEATSFIRQDMGEPYCNIPIVAITAYDPHDFFNDFKDVGFDEILTKPYLYQKIRKIIDNVNLLKVG